MTEPHDSAFARPEGQYQNAASDGLSKREYFAAAALQGLLTNAAIDRKQAAGVAVSQADALIEELNKPKP